MFEVFSCLQKLNVLGCSTMTRCSSWRSALSIALLLMMGAFYNAAPAMAGTTSTATLSPRINLSESIPIFKSDFANRSLKGFIPELPNTTRNTFVPWSARYVYQIQLYKTDPIVYGKKRAELALPPVSATGEYTYRFSEFLAGDFIPDVSAESIAQWHDTPDTALGEDYRTPGFALLTQKGHLWAFGRWDPNALTLNNRPGPGGGMYSVDLGPYSMKTWNNFIVHAKWSYGADGVLEVYNNGKRIFQRFGPNSYNDQVGPYMKLGVYKWDWTEDPALSLVGRRSLFLDNVRVDKGNVW